MPSRLNQPTRLVNSDQAVTPATPDNSRSTRQANVQIDPVRSLPVRSLLDLGRLPVAELSGFAHREARRQRPIYGAHKWFARRLGTAFRSLLVAAATDESGDFWDAYYGSADLRGITVLDTFVGGGTALVEAQRLGATVIGFDVDPVAAAVTRFELSAADQADPEQILDALRVAVAGKLADFHQALEADGEPAPNRQVLHHFWVQIVPCRGCQNEIHAHPTWQIAADPPAASKTRNGRASGALQHVMCRHCHEILARPIERSRVRCGNCARVTVIADGVVAGGVITCPECATTERLIDVALRTKQPPQWHLFAQEVIENDGPRRPSMRQRHFRAATDADRALVEAAELALSQREPSHAAYIPATKIPTKGRVDDRPLRYGYVRYRDLFNPRQLLHLSLLAEAILELPDEQRGVAALAFSNHLTTSCMLTSYAAGWRRLVPLFSIRAYRHVPRPVEVNPWLDGTGRGTFPNALRQVAGAIAFAKEPRELTSDGFTSVPAVAPEKEARVFCRSSEDLSVVESGSVALLLSDPPYLDNIAYSELSDFFAPWLRLLKVTSGTRVHQARETNLSAGGRGEDDAAVFARRLGACFREAERVLATHGRIVFTYQHATATGWHSLGQALATASLVPVNVIPLQGDGGFGLHTHAGSTIFDAILVLRPRPGNPRKRPPEDVDELPTLTLSQAGEASARQASQAWASQLARELPGLFREPDRINLLRAHLIAGALNEWQNRADVRAQCDGVSARPLLETLNDTSTGSTAHTSKLPAEGA